MAPQPVTAPRQKFAAYRRPVMNRSTSLPRRLDHMSSVTCPAGDGVTKNRNLAYIPPGFPGLRTLFTNGTNRTSAHTDDTELFSDCDLESPTSDIQHVKDIVITPMRKVSQAVLSLLSSDTVTRTASAIFTSAAQIGSQIVTKGLEVANHLLQDDFEVVRGEVREEEVTCRGFCVKVRGDDLDLQSIHLEKTKLQVRIQVGSKLLTSDPRPPFSDADNNLILTFGAGNSIRVETPVGTNLGDLNWATSDAGILTLHLQ